MPNPHMHTGNFKKIGGKFASTLPAVRKTPQMLDIEARHAGEDIRLIIKALYERLGTQTAVAKELGLEQSVINIWAARLGITFASQPLATITALTAAELDEQTAQDKKLRAAVRKAAKVAPDTVTVSLTAKAEQL